MFFFHISIFLFCQGDKTGIEYIANPEMIIKHPLENTWTLWYFKNDRAKDWEENQREVNTIPSKLIEIMFCSG